MDIKKVLFFLQIMLLSFISVNAYSVSQYSIRPATRGDIGYNTTASVQSSNPAIATASVKGDIIIPGIHTLSITSLATAEQLASVNSYRYTTDPLGMTESFTIYANNSHIVVDIAMSDSLNDITNKINSAANAAHLNVFAYVVATNSYKYQLVVGSTQTGTANAVKISESGSRENRLEMEMKLSAARDAKFTLDNLSYSTASNNPIIGEWLIINLVGIGYATLTVSEM